MGQAGKVRAALMRVLPHNARGFLWRQDLRRRSAVARFKDVEFVGALPRSPISRTWGYERGQPIDRFYMEAFLADHATDVAGEVLEFGDDRYTKRFGGARVKKGDVLDVVEGNPKSTLVADLTRANELASQRFDCIICTQVLQMIFDLRPAVAEMERLLKPGGVLLVTASSISRIGRREGVDFWGEYWRFTTQSLSRLLLTAFSPGSVAVKSYGNVLTATAFLYGLAAAEIPAGELSRHDPDFEVLVAARAVKDTAA